MSHLESESLDQQHRSNNTIDQNTAIIKNNSGSCFLGNVLVDVIHVINLRQLFHWHFRRGGW